MTFIFPACRGMADDIIAVGRQTAAKTTNKASTRLCVRGYVITPLFSQNNAVARFCMRGYVITPSFHEGFFFPEFVSFIALTTDLFQFPVPRATQCMGGV
jgi:hypothetical protein